MVIVRMPGGDVESIAPDELLWMRQAFDHEFKDAVMLRITGDRIYSWKRWRPWPRSSPQPGPPWLG